VATIIGIDLGTTNSLVSVFRDGASEIIPNALGEALTPSVVGMDESGELLVGRTARERLVTHPELTVGSFKRYMGTSRQLALGKLSFRPEELSALVLKSLKADAEAFLGEPVDEAIVTVPAYFSDPQRKATRLAGELAGLKVERLLNEPTAAALAYGLQERGNDHTFLVFDLGGGTFDVSLLELFDDVMEVRASAGDNFLGGDDFIRRIMDGFVHAYEKPELLDDPSLAGLLYSASKRAMHDLTLKSRTTVSMPFEGKPLQWEIDHAIFQELSEPLLKKLRDPMERALRDAKLKASDLDDVVLVGGASRIRIVREMVARLVGRIPSSHIDPDRIIAIGAGVQAGLKARDAVLRDVVMTDVCPFTLGTAVNRKRSKGEGYTSGHYLPILERNCTVPVSRVERLFTTYDNQRMLHFDVYQGESRVAADNIRLGELEIPIPPKPAGEVSVDVRFTYDINGLLEVETTVLGTNTTKRVVIEDNPGVLSKKEIEERFKALAALKMHPRDREENRAVMARAERLYEEHLDEVRQMIGRRADAFQEVLVSQDPAAVEEARKELEAWLEQLESDPFLM
jgi:molecular chaperone HscC